MAAYGADKLNDPAKAEPVVQKMIQLEPGEPANYFALAKIYEDAGAYDEAEKILQAAKQAKPWAGKRKRTTWTSGSSGSPANPSFCGPCRRMS